MNKFAVHLLFLLILIRLERGLLMASCSYQKKAEHIPEDAKKI